jgi:hypothetical protein
MPTYEDVLSLAKCLSPSDQVRLLGELAALIQPVEVEDSDEVIPADEIAVSEAALLAYRTGHDPGVSSVDIKQRLFEGKLG